MSSFAKSSQGGEYLVSRFGPYKRFALIVRQLDVLKNGLLKLARASVNTSSELLFGQRGEPSLDEIEPGGASRGEVEVIARALGQPAVYKRRLVGPVVVQDDVDIQVGGHRGIDVVEELAELHRAMARVASADHLAGGNLKGSKERGGAMTGIVVSAPLDLPRTHWQQRSGTIQGLNA